MKLRKNKNHVDVDDFKEVLTDYKGVKDAENKLLINNVFEYISDEERNILILHAVSGLKHREIAKMLEKKREIEKRLNQTFSNMVPDVLDNILTQCKEREVMEDMKLINKNKEEKKERKNKLF